MPYLLDTDVIIDHLRGRRRIDDTVLNNSFISVITFGELEYGFQKRKLDDSVLFEFLERHNILIIDINQEIMMLYAKLRAKLEKKGKRLSDFDLLIGATALYYGFVLITNNKKHFQRIPGIVIK